LGCCWHCRCSGMLAAFCQHRFLKPSWVWHILICRRSRRWSWRDGSCWSRRCYVVYLLLRPFKSL
jgi:hypothetical protein